MTSLTSKLNSPCPRAETGLQRICGYSSRIGRLLCREAVQIRAFELRRAVLEVAARGPGEVFRPSPFVRRWSPGSVSRPSAHLRAWAPSFFVM